MVDPVDDGRTVDDQPKGQSYRYKYQNICENRESFPTGGGTPPYGFLAGSRSLEHSTIQM
jgi:hypothetical protein